MAAVPPTPSPAGCDPLTCGRLEEHLTRKGRQERKEWQEEIPGDRSPGKRVSRTAVRRAADVKVKGRGSALQGVANASQGKATLDNGAHVQKRTYRQAPVHFKN